MMEKCQKTLENLKHMKRMKYLSKKTISLYVKSIGVILTGFILVYAFFQQIFQRYFEKWCNDTFASSLVVEKNEASMAEFYKLIVIFGVITLLRGIFWTFGVLKGASFLFKKVLHKFIFAKIDFYDKHTTGELTNSFSNDISSVDTAIPETWNGLFEEVLTVLAIIFVFISTMPIMLVRNVSFAIQCTFLLSCCLFSTLSSLEKLSLFPAILPKIHWIDAREKKRRAPLSCPRNFQVSLISGNLWIIFSGILTIRAFSRQHYFQQKLWNFFSEFLVLKIANREVSDFKELIKYFRQGYYWRGRFISTQ